MSSLIACPGCQYQLMLPAETAGQRVQCPQCALEFAPVAAAISAMEVDEPPKETAYTPARRSPAPAVPGSIYCTLCGTKFSRAEVACPKCAHPCPESFEEMPRERRRRPRRMLQPIRGNLPIVAIVLIPLGLAFFAGGGIASDLTRHAPPPAGFWHPLVLVFTGLVIVVSGLVCGFVWLYQAWRMILRGDEDYSPGLMVGLLFVPFFNLYWIFRAVPGLSMAIQDELRYLAPARSPNAGLVAGIVACVFALIPYGQPIAICIFLAWMLIVNNALHRLIRYHDEARGEDDERADSMDVY